MTRKLAERSPAATIGKRAESRPSTARLMSARIESASPTKMPSGRQPRRGDVLPATRSSGSSNVPARSSTPNVATRMPRALSGTRRSGTAARPPPQAERGEGADQDGGGPAQVAQRVAEGEEPRLLVVGEGGRQASSAASLSAATLSFRFEGLSLGTAGRRPAAPVGASSGTGGILGDRPRGRPRDDRALLCGSGVCSFSPKRGPPSRQRTHVATLGGARAEGAEDGRWGSLIPVEAILVGTCVSGRNSCATPVGTRLRTPLMRSTIPPPNLLRLSGEASLLERKAIAVRQHRRAHRNNARRRWLRADTGGDTRLRWESVPGRFW